MTAYNKKRLKRYNDYVIFLYYVGCLTLLPIFMPNAYFINVLIFMFFNTIMVIGLYLLWGCAGQINLAPAAFYGIGAYSSAILTTQYGLSPISGLMIGLFVTVSVALAIGLPSLRLSLFYFAIATLGFGIIIHIIFIQLKRLTGGQLGIGEIPGFRIATITFEEPISYYYLCLIWLAVCLIIAINIVNSRIGMAWIASGDNDLAAQSLSINSFACKLQAFLFSAAYCSVAGSLYSHYITFISPSVFNVGFTISLIVMVIIGGLVSIWGPVTGVVVLTIMTEVARSYGEYDAFIYSIILIVVMMYMPEGLFGTTRRVLRGLKKRTV